MLKHTMSGFFIAMVAGVGLPGLSYAQDDNPDVSAFTCKEIMRVSGPDRDLAIALMHGYILGESGTSSFNTEILADASEKFVDSCLDNPTAKALETLRDASK